MKNFKFLTVLAIASISFFSSCTKILSSDFDPEKGDKVAVNVCVRQPSTKATGVTEKADLKVNNLQVFAFLNGNLDVYGSSEKDSLVLSCTQGKRNFYAVINAPDLKSITTEQQLKDATSKLTNSSLTSLEMIGSKEATIGKDNRSVEISVNRLASRIVVSKVTKAFKSTALNSLTFKIKKMYLVNASGEAKYGSPSTPVTWYNQKAFDENLPDKLKALMFDNVDATVSSSYTTKHTFYCYPNNTQTDVNDGDKFSARFTRLVIEAELGGEICYYPINLPNLESNKSYNISEIEITKPGSTSPDEPVTAVDCKVTLVVNDWTDVDVNSGTTV